MNQTKAKNKQLEKLLTIIEKNAGEKAHRQKYATVKEIITLMGKGVLLSSLFIAPGMGRAIERSNRDNWHKEWRKFNKSYLRRSFETLRKNKVVEIVEKGDLSEIRLTEKGVKRVMAYTLETLDLTLKRWDGKWRMVLYDIPVKHRHTQRAFRNMLKRLKFLQLQKSVYLTPYPCIEEVEFLREYFGLSTNVTVLTVGELENSHVYREYFGL